MTARCEPCGLDVLACFDAARAALRKRKRPDIPSGDMIAIVKAVLKTAAERADPPRDGAGADEPPR